MSMGLELELELESEFEFEFEWVHDAYDAMRMMVMKGVHLHGSIGAT